MLRSEHLRRQSREHPVLPTRNRRSLFFGLIKGEHLGKKFSADYGLIAKTTPQPRPPLLQARLPPREAVPYRVPAEPMTKPAFGNPPSFPPLKRYSTVSRPLV